MRRHWVAVVILALGITACGSNLGTAIPQPLWPSAQRWVDGHARPAAEVVFVGTSDHPSAPRFYGTSVFNTDTAVEFSVRSSHVRVPAMGRST